MRQQGEPVGKAFHEVEAVAQRLHDVVMQRLFATGLRLHSVASAITGKPAEAVTAAAQDLDETMADIRTAIQDLRRAATPTETTLGAALLALPEPPDPPREE